MAERTGPAPLAVFTLYNTGKVMTQEQFDSLEDHLQSLALEVHFLAKCFDSLTRKQLNGVEQDVVFLVSANFDRLTESFAVVEAVFGKIAAKTAAMQPSRN